MRTEDANIFRLKLLLLDMSFKFRYLKSDMFGIRAKMATHHDQRMSADPNMNKLKVIG